jgi:hypothetical protein
MPRSRAALTDKEERILVQAQLMGLSTASMVKIGNRLKALEQERDEIARINDVCQGFGFSEKPNQERLEVTTPDGHTIVATRGKKGTSRWNYFAWSYDITVSKPGTRFKSRTYKNREVRCDYDWKKKLMPAKSKELYGLIQWAKNSMPWDKDFENS